MSLPQGHDQPATKADIERIIQASIAGWTEGIDRKLSNVKTELVELQEKHQALQEKSVSELKEKNRASGKKKWKREGNQRQFEFNQQVLAKC